MFAEDVKSDLFPTSDAAEGDGNVDEDPPPPAAAGRDARVGELIAVEWREESPREDVSSRMRSASWRWRTKAASSREASVERRSGGPTTMRHERKAEVSRGQCNFGFEPNLEPKWLEPKWLRNKSRLFWFVLLHVSLQQG